MSAGSILTLGYGLSGSASRVITLGYGPGEEIVTPVEPVGFGRAQRPAQIIQVEHISLRVSGGGAIRLRIRKETEQPPPEEQEFMLLLMAT